MTVGGQGLVVVNRSMSLDGFVAGTPGGRPDWPRMARFVASEDLAAIAADTGAMLVGRRTWDVGDEMEAAEPGAVDYPFHGPMFLLTHRPISELDPDVTILSGDIGDAVATALDAAGGKNLEILGTDVARQCFERGLVDEVLVYVLPILVGAGVPIVGPISERVVLKPFSAQQSGEATILRFRVGK